MSATMANTDTVVLHNGLKIVPFTAFSFFVYFDLSHPPSAGSDLLINTLFLRQAHPARCDLLSGKVTSVVSPVLREFLPLLPTTPGLFANAPCAAQGRRRARSSRVRRLLAGRGGFRPAGGDLSNRL